MEGFSILRNLMRHGRLSHLGTAPYRGCTSGSWSQCLPPISTGLQGWGFDRHECEECECHRIEISVYSHLALQEHQSHQVMSVTVTTLPQIPT